GQTPRDQCLTHRTAVPSRSTCPPAFRSFRFLLHFRQSWHGQPFDKHGMDPRSPFPVHAPSEGSVFSAVSPRPLVSRAARRLSVLLAVLLLGGATPALAVEIPPYLPHYDLDVRSDTEQHVVHVKQRVTWLNYHDCAAKELVFNVH